MSVLDDVDLSPADDGVLLPGSPPAFVSWEAVAQALGPHEPLSAAGRHRVCALLRLFRLVADLGGDAPRRVHEAARLLALPPDHALHPGPAWVRGQVPGGALDLGVGLLGVTGQDGCVPLPPGLPVAPTAQVDGWWPELRAHADRMGALAARRVGSGGRAVLRPVGGCDALTLLASAPLRAGLAGRDGTGMRAAALPRRARGWIDLARIDHAYVSAVWSLTPEPDRGVPRPLLVTRDEVTLPAAGGRPAEHAFG